MWCINLTPFGYTLGRSNQKTDKGLLTNNFCHAQQILSVKLKNPTLLFLTDNIKTNGIPTKIEWKIHPLFIVYFKFWRYFFVNKPSDLLFLVVILAFTSARHHFSQIFRRKTKKIMTISYNTLSELILETYCMQFLHGMPFIFFGI